MNSIKKTDNQLCSSTCASKLIGDQEVEIVNSSFNPAVKETFGSSFVKTTRQQSVNLNVNTPSHARIYADMKKILIVHRYTQNI